MPVSTSVVKDVSVVLWFTISILANVLRGQTWTVYETAPDDGFHVSVGFVMPVVVPSAGEDSTGAAGTVNVGVTKDHVPDQALVPPAFAAFTRQ